MIDKETEIRVHSQRMLALSDELNDIVGKIYSGEYKIDDDAEYYQCELNHCSPSYCLLYDNLAPLNYKNLSKDTEFSTVSLYSLLTDYEEFIRYGKKIKCAELVAFSNKLLAFIKDEAPEYITDLTSDFKDILQPLPEEVEAELDKALEKDDID